MSLSAEPSPLTIFQDFMADTETASCLNCGAQIGRHFGSKSWFHVGTETVWCATGGAA